MMQDLIKVKAKVELFEGELLRKKPFATNYRPIFTFVGAKTKISGSISLLDRNLFYPGSTAIVFITFLKGMLPDTYFRIGEHFNFSEGLNDIGKGEIIGIEMVTDL